jgi:NAD/NADP transhydrogenase alpha subunit
MKMKRIAGMVFGLGAILSLVLVASFSLAQETKKNAEKATTEDIKKGVKETARTTAAYTRQQKEEYQKKIEAQLKK